MIILSMISLIALLLWWFVNFPIVLLLCNFKFFNYFTICCYSRRSFGSWARGRPALERRSTALVTRGLRAPDGFSCEHERRLPERDSTAAGVGTALPAAAASASGFGKRRVLSTIERGKRARFLREFTSLLWTQTADALLSMLQRGPHYQPSMPRKPSSLQQRL